jgi:hypothetical protein
MKSLLRSIDSDENFLHMQAVLKAQINKTDRNDAQCPARRAYESNDAGTRVNLGSWTRQHFPKKLSAQPQRE